jgi:hypothetical protein
LKRGKGYRTVPVMIFAAAMILLADAEAPCSAPGADGLAGGATVIRPVAAPGSLPFEPLGPTSDIRTRPTEIQQTAAEQRVEDQPAAQCDAVALPIV